MGAYQAKQVTKVGGMMGNIQVIAGCFYEDGCFSVQTYCGAYSSALAI